MLQLKKPEELVDEMKAKGMKFEIMNENDAVQFLVNNTYYKKISSYQKNFHTYKKDGIEFFSNLDFAYLRELSTIDMHLRRIIFDICINIEHSVKVDIINNCLVKKEDGFKIVEEFFVIYPKTMDNINNNATNSYCTDLIKTHAKKIPLWVLLEVISFGDLCKLFRFLAGKGYYDMKDSELLYQVHNLRNASAHSHCLIYDLRPGDSLQVLHKISVYVSSIKDIDKNERKNRLSNRFINDFVTMWFSLEYFIKGTEIKNILKEEMRNLFYGRMIKNKKYFINCISVKNAYVFLKKVVDN